MYKTEAMQNILTVDGKGIVFESDIQSWVTYNSCICVQLYGIEDNLVCVDYKGKIRWKGSDLYKKNTQADIIAQVAPNLLKVVWGNGDVKVINVLKGEIHN